MESETNSENKKIYEARTISVGKTILERKMNLEGVTLLKDKTAS